MKCVTGKVEYDSQVEARVQLAIFWCSLRRKRHKEKRSYKCNLCRKWHLTSKAKRSR